MARDHLITMGMEYRKDVARLLPRVLFFGLILIITNMLEIKPSEIDAGGVKIILKDVAIIHGGISLVFYYYFWMLVSSTINDTIYLPFDTDHMKRSMLRLAKKPYRNNGKGRLLRRTPFEAKRVAKDRLLLYNLFAIPFVIIVMLIITIAFLLGFLNLIDLWAYLFNYIVKL